MFCSIFVNRYDDDVPGMLYNTNFFYRPAKVCWFQSLYMYCLTTSAQFPTRNISTPILLLYGESDSLVHIETMLSELPDHTVAKGVNEIS